MSQSTVSRRWDLLSGIRAAVERAVAHFKCRRMFSEEGGRFRAPIEKFAETLTTTIGLLNLARPHGANK